MATSSTRAERGTQSDKFKLRRVLIGAYVGSGKAFRTKIGVGKVIKGWDEGAHNCSPTFDLN